MADVITDLTDDQIHTTWLRDEPVTMAGDDAADQTDPTDAADDADDDASDSGDTDGTDGDADGTDS